MVEPPGGLGNSSHAYRERIPYKDLWCFHRGSRELNRCERKHRDRRRREPATAHSHILSLLNYLGIWFSASGQVTRGARARAEPEAVGPEGVGSLAGPRGAPIVKFETPGSRSAHRPFRAMSFLTDNKPGWRCTGRVCRPDPHTPERELATTKRP
jgi:hypothetical protein